MPRPLQFAECAPAAVELAAQELGARLRLARVRRQLSQRALALRAGISYVTIRSVEAGSLQTGLGAYLAVVWALGLESELAAFLDPDKDAEGKLLERARTPRRARAKSRARAKNGGLDADFS